MNEILFDRKLLLKNRKRCERNFADHNFLHHEIANRILDNINLQNKEFNSVLEISTFGNFFKQKIFHKKFIRTKFSKDHFGNPSEFELLADDEFLPFKPESFDLIISNLNLHFINKIPEFLLKVKNILKPDGLFIASFFGEKNLSELSEVLSLVENEIYGGISPRISPTIDIKTSANLLAKAGFINPVSDLEKILVEYQEPLKLLKDLKYMGQGNIMSKRSRRFFTKKFLQRIVEIYQQKFKNNAGTFDATFEVITVSGNKIR